MSIIVAVRKKERIVLAADTLSVFGSNSPTVANHSAKKLRRVGSSIMGSTGWALYANILDDYLASKEEEPVLLSEPDVFRFFLELWQAMKEHYSFVNDQCADDDSPFANLDASFVVANQDAIFHIGSNLSITRFEQYTAVGCAADYALGALFATYEHEDDPEALARKAVSASMALDIHCGGDVDVMEI